jgi:His-Xaa-Ser system protein HxsD
LQDIIVEFDRATQSVGALQEAAYRVIDLASCIVETAGERFVCRLLPKEGVATDSLGERGIRLRFIDLVTDENLRERVSAQTDGLRNVIVALAFGALAEQGDGTPTP